MGMPIERALEKEIRKCRIIAGEYADVGIAFDSDENERIISEIKEDQRVEKIYLYNDMEIYHDKNNLKCYVTDDMKNLNNSEICYEGRLPQFFNEIALGGKYAAKFLDNIKEKYGDQLYDAVNIQQVIEASVGFFSVYYNIVARNISK